MAHLFNIGDKVVPIEGSLGRCSDGEESEYAYSVIRERQGSGSYIYDSFDANGSKISACGCWDDQHLKLYGEPMPKRTFMLRKDTPSMLKGALLQDNGNSTSPYVMINSQTHSKDPSFTISFAKRELIEEAPAWFVEVFQVEPQYMTQTELDQYEAFKTTLKNKTKKVKKA